MSKNRSKKLSMASMTRIAGEVSMKANLNDATHYNERTDEYWLLEDGVYYLYLNGFWQVARPKLNGMVEL